MPERPIIETFELTEEPDGGTRLAWRLKFEDHSRIARWTLKAMTRLFGGGIRQGGAKLARAIEEDLAN